MAHGNGEGGRGARGGYKLLLYHCVFDSPVDVATSDESGCARERVSSALMLLQLFVKGTLKPACHSILEARPGPPLRSRMTSQVVVLLLLQLPDRSMSIEN